MSELKLRRAIFLDKDGTLIEDIPYSVDPAKIRFTPGAARALRLMHALDYALVVVSNQSGVARGIFPENALIGVAQRLREMFAESGVPLTGFYFCPHHTRGTITAYRVDCDCRKPAPGMLRRAAREHHIDLARSWMVGDILDDVEAGKRVGCRTILVERGTEFPSMIPARQPDWVVNDLAQAAKIILQNEFNLTAETQR